MSCNVLRDESIATLAAWLYDQVSHNGDYGYCLIQTKDLIVLDDVCHPYNSPAMEKRYPINPAALYRAMKTLNMRAYFGRYEQENATRELTSIIAEPVPTVSFYGIPKLAMLKKLDCFIYQCSEETTETDALYRTLEAIRNSFRDRIIMTLPEYDAAAWG